MFLKMLASFLLLFNGVGAIYGGWNLILYPDGSKLNMSTEILVHSPFTNFLVPGLILYIVNGLFSLVILFLLLIHYKKYAGLVALQGFILCTWLTVQMLMLHMMVPLHAVLGMMGLLLIFCGWKLNHIEHLPRDITNEFI